MDYRLARGEQMLWGDNQLDLLSFHASKVAYDVAVDIIDNADGDCLVTFIMRDDIYSRADAAQLAKSYVHLATTFAAQSDMILGQADILDKSHIEETLALGRGQFLSCVGSIMSDIPGLTNILVSTPFRPSLQATRLGRYSHPPSRRHDQEIPKKISCDCWIW